MPDPEQWEEYFDWEASEIRSRHHAPGVAIILQAAEQKPNFERAWGRANLGSGPCENGRQLYPDTLIRAGSISKVVTAIAVLQQVEAGNLSLNDRIGDILNWTLPYGYGKATICDLLTHRSGIGDRFAGQSDRNAAAIADLSGYLRTSMPPPVAPVGETITYSNFGISLAGLAVEILTHKPFAVYAQERIFNPMGMNAASFIPDEAVEHSIAEGYNWIFKSHRALPLRHWRAYPAASLVASPQELGRVMRGLLNQSTGLLDRPEVLFEDQFSPVSGVPGMSLGLWLDRIQGQQVAWHTGHMPGHRTGFYIFPESGFGIVLYYNTDTKILRQFLDRICSFAFANDQKASHPKGAKPLESMAEYGGHYRHSWYPHHHFGKSSALLGKEGEELTVHAGEGRLSIADEIYLPQSKDVFISPRSHHRIGFIRDQKNRIRGLYSGGRDRYERIAFVLTSKAQIVFAIFCLSVFAVCAFFFLSSIFTVRPKLPLFTACCLLITCAANLTGTGSLFALVAQGAYRITEDVPASLGSALAVPVLGAFAWVCALIHFVLLSGTIGAATVAGTVAVAITSAAELGFLCFLNYWNLLGHRY